MRSLPTLDELRAVHDKYPVDPADVRAVMARVPPSWKMVACPDATFVDGRGAAFVRGTIQVLMSVDRYDDGELWLHVSACGRTGQKAFYLPSWEELKRVKHDFIGEDRWAYQVLPPASEYINQHPCVLHMFAHLDGAAALPDFTRGLGVL